VSCALQAIEPEPIPAIPLTTYERKLKTQLEAVVAEGIENFLKVGRALCEIRNKRLFRTEAIDFATYCRTRFGLARSSADQLIRSAHTAETLMEAGIDLTGASEAAIRPLTAFADSDLQGACWQLAQSFAPERGPTVRLVGRLCEVVRGCLNDDDDDDQDSLSTRSGFQRGSTPRRHEELPFARPVARLASWNGFSASVIVAGVDSLESAEGLYRSCGILTERCQEVQAVLAASYPELATNA
jgi:hypothetical protein